MNSNSKDKVKDFFRKEGFYFILFICLCIVAVVAAFTIKKNNALKQSSNPSNEFTLNIEEADDSRETSRTEMPNADRVENGNENEVAEESNETEEVASNEEVEDYTEVAENTEEIVENTEDVPTSASVSEVVFQLPLEGLVSREYKEMVRLQSTESGTLDRTRRGIDLKASIGDVVKAAADGEVVEVSSSTEDGNYIVIEHSNGLKTKYGNLSDEVSVAVGDTVYAGDEIGTVGNSSLIFTSEICGDVLNVQVEDAEGNQLNPCDYFNF